MYAIYLNDMERFVAIESDLWIVLLASKLLSSKLSICVCDIGETDAIDNFNCFQWKLATPELPASTQYPKLIKVENPRLVYSGNPINFDIEIFLKHQSFCLTVLKVLKAAKLTDAVLNFADRKYFQTLLGVDDVNSTADDSGVPEGFLLSVERILYLSTSEEEINQSLDLMFNDKESIFPRNLQMYKETFYKFLNV